MNKYGKIQIVVIMIMVVSLLLCACNNEAPDLEQNSVETTNFAQESGDESKNDHLDATYEYAVVSSEGLHQKIWSAFTESSSLGLYTDVFQEQISGVKAARTSPFTSAETSYQYSNCSESKKGSAVKGDFYSVYDVYKNDQEDLIYLHDADLLCRYFFRENYTSESVSMTKEEALTASNTFLAGFLSQEQLNKFESPDVEEGPDGILLYSIVYVRKIAGYDTDETIMVLISPSGKIVGYNGENLNKYDGYIDVITKEKVATSEELLKDRIQSTGLTNYTMDSPVIVTNTEGKLFLKICVRYVDEYGIEVAEECMVSIPDETN